MVIASAATGRQVVGARGELVLPAPIRRLCGIACGSSVVLAAYPSLGLVAVHPVVMVARLLRDFHARLTGADHVG